MKKEVIEKDKTKKIFYFFYPIDLTDNDLSKIIIAAIYKMVIAYE